MKFKVCQFDDETSARKGKLKINGKTIDTPTLWIGHTIGGKPEPWKSFPVDNLLVNAYEILKKPSVFGEINKKGIHKYLDFDGLVLMDSGGFLFQKKNDIDVDASTILQLYHDSDPDIGVILDDPFDLSKSRRINNRRWKVTINNET